MTQLIITLIIVFASVATAVYLFVRRLRKKPKPTDNCSGCSSECGQCGFYKEGFGKEEAGKSE